MASDSAPAQTLTDAWRQYVDGFEQLRKDVFACEFARDPAERAKAQYWLLQAQAASYNLVVAPKQAYPALFVNTVFEPNVYNWLLPNADFKYRYAFLDGKRSYRIHGQRGTSLHLDAQVMSGFWGDPDMRQLGNHDFARFTASDGTIDVTVGPASMRGSTAAWLDIDAQSSNNMLLIREMFNDWETERPATLHIEPLDKTPVSIQPTDADLVRRMAAALLRVRFCYETFSAPFTQSVMKAAGTNAFHHVNTTSSNDGSHPDAGYVPAVYELAADEALVIEFRQVKARYWNLVLSDVWLQAADFVNRQSTLNGAQVQLDDDELIRVVIAASDPGVQNWLDPGGNLTGMVLLRWYFAERFEVPTIRRVKLDRLREHLPSTTRTVSPAARSEQLERRRRAVLARYGY